MGGGRSGREEVAVTPKVRFRLQTAETFGKWASQIKSAAKADKKEGTSSDCPPTWRSTQDTSEPASRTIPDSFAPHTTVPVGLLHSNNRAI